MNLKKLFLVEFSFLGHFLKVWKPVIILIDFFFLLPYCFFVCWLLKVQTISTLRNCERKDHFPTLLPVLQTILDGDSLSHCLLTVQSCWLWHWTHVNVKGIMAFTVALGVCSGIGEQNKLIKISPPFFDQILGVICYFPYRFGGSFCRIAVFKIAFIFYFLDHTKDSKGKTSV